MLWFALQRQLRVAGRFPGSIPFVPIARPKLLPSSEQRQRVRANRPGAFIQVPRPGPISLPAGFPLAGASLEHKQGMDFRMFRAAVPGVTVMAEAAVPATTPVRNHAIFQADGFLGPIHAWTNTTTNVSTVIGNTKTTMMRLNGPSRSCSVAFRTT
jgi:hypothetical protein